MFAGPKGKQQKYVRQLQSQEQYIFRDGRVHIFSDNLSRNSCIPQRPGEAMRGGCIHKLLPLHPVKLVPEGLGEVLFKKMRVQCVF